MVTDLSKLFSQSCGLDTLWNLIKTMYFLVHTHIHTESFQAIHSSLEANPFTPGQEHILEVKT